MSADTPGPVSAHTPPESRTGPVAARPAYDALTKKQREWLDTYFVAGRNQTAASRAMGYKAPEKHGHRMSKNVRVEAAIAERLAALEIDASEVLYRIDQRARASAEDFLTFEERDVETHREVPAAERIAELREEAARVRLVARRLEEAGVARAGEEQDAEEEALSYERRAVKLEVALELDPEATASVAGEPRRELVARLDLVAMRDAGKLHLVKSVTEQKDGSVKLELHDAAKADELLMRYLGLLTDRVDITTGGEPLQPIRLEIVNAPGAKPPGLDSAGSSGEVAGGAAPVGGPPPAQ